MMQDGFETDTDETQVTVSDRTYIATRTLKISMLVTVFIGLIELIFWFFSRNSVFMIEGIGNIVWLVPDIIMIYTVGIGSRKPDWSMHYGYRRAETIFLLFFSLAVAGFMLFLLFNTLTGPQEPLPAGYGPATIVLSLIIIAVLGLLVSHILTTGRKIRSRMLIVDAMIIRMDIASAAVLLASGLFLVFLPSVGIIQTILTAIVGLVLIAYCFDEARNAVSELLDASPSLQVTNLVERIAEEMPEVRFVSELRLRSFGGAIAADLTIETDPDIPLYEAYRIGSGLEDRIRSQVDNIIEVRVRVHPGGTYVANEMAVREHWD